jgi:hypothetical protein
MKRLCVFLFLFALLSVAALARKDDGDFPLTVHITAVNVEQGQEGIEGSGSTDSNGNYSSSVSGGGSYTWKVFTAQIEGDNKFYTLNTARRHYKGGRGLAVATLGWSVAATAKPNYWLGIGGYHGRWNKDGTLEIQFTDAKGKPTHQTFWIESEVASQSVPVPTLLETTQKAMADATMQLIAKGQASHCAVVTNPVGAEIYIDGEPALKEGKILLTPTEFILRRQSNLCEERCPTRIVTIKMAGYKAVEKTIVPDGKDVSLAIFLEKDIN